MAPPRQPRPRDRCRRLTERQIEVLADYVWFGAEEAAARHGISVATVRKHVANARSKVGVSTTAQLVHVLSRDLPLPNGIINFGK